MTQMNNDGKILIFRPWYKKKDGTIVYPKNGKVFPMWVDPKDAGK